jgi:hypothetical protein
VKKRKKRNQIEVKDKVIQEIKLENVRAQSDRLELMRDFATY